MDMTQVSEALAADHKHLEQARILADMAQYSTMEAAAITNGLIVTRKITDIEEAYQLFEEVRKHAMGRLWQRTAETVMANSEP